MLGVSLGAGLGLSAATSIRLLLAADTAHADAAVAAPPAQERTLKMDMQRSQASVLMQAGDIRTVSPALERYLQGTLFGDLWNRPICQFGTAPSSRSQP